MTTGHHFLAAYCHEFQSKITAKAMSRLWRHLPKKSLLNSPTLALAITFATLFYCARTIRNSQLWIGYTTEILLMGDAVHVHNVITQCFQLFLFVGCEIGIKWFPHVDFESIFFFNDWQDKTQAKWCVAYVRTCICQYVTYLYEAHINKHGRL